jgi:hypothetical protein
VIDGQFALHDGSKVTIDGVAPASDVSAN